jgi:hypothetical protein
MKKMTILVPATVATALLTAVVFASTPTSETQGTVAKAPNRAELFAIATCDAPAGVATVQATSWQNALGSKRALDRALVLAKDSAAEPCDSINK